MKKDRFIAAVILVLGIAAVVVSIACESQIKKGFARLTYDYNDEQIISSGYFDVFVPKDENRHLPSDVVSYSFGDGYVHVVLPTAVNEKNVVVYIRNEAEEYMSRRVCDFTQDVYVGDWQIVVDRPDLPVLYFMSNHKNDYENMIASESTDMKTQGNMQICVNEDAARENGWNTEYLSSESGYSRVYEASLQGRGSSSWDCNVKKSFSLRLEKKLNLLGMGANKNWNLIGCAYDVSLLKNTVFNKLASDAGIGYQPKMQYVDLYVDGVYQGVYLLTTKISVDESRVALSKHDFFYKMDPPTQDQPIYYDSQTWFEDGNDRPVADLLYPKKASDTQLKEAQEKLQKVIDAMEDPYSDDLYGLVDVDSLIRYYWVQEATMNFDAWQRSVYMYYSAKDGKMHFGPVWDMDITLGSPYTKANMAFDSAQGYRIRYAGWYSSLFLREDFVEDVRDIYYNKGVRDALRASVDEFIKQKDILAQDGYLNFAMFGHANQGTTIMYGDTYDEYCNNMIAFYVRRLDWIDEQMSQ